MWAMSSVWLELGFGQKGQYKNEFEYRWYRAVEQTRYCRDVCKWKAWNFFDIWVTAPVEKRSYQIIYYMIWNFLLSSPTHCAGERSATSTLDFDTDRSEIEIWFEA